MTGKGGVLIVSLIILSAVLLLILISTFVYEEFACPGYVVGDFLSLIQIITSVCLTFILLNLIYRML